MVLRDRTPSCRDLRCALPIRWHLLPGGQLAQGGDHAGVHQARPNTPQWSGEEARFLVRSEAGSEAKAQRTCILYASEVGGWPWVGTKTG
jgi:hypothetical protein